MMLRVMEWAATWEADCFQRMGAVKSGRVGAAPLEPVWPACLMSAQEPPGFRSVVSPNSYTGHPQRPGSALLSHGQA